MPENNDDDGGTDWTGEASEVATVASSGEGILTSIVFVGLFMILLKLVVDALEAAPIGFSSGIDDSIEAVFGLFRGGFESLAAIFAGVGELFGLIGDLFGVGAS